jgi:NADH:ubiquinone oxidoreductase subunit 2 (subunit N)
LKNLGAVLSAPFFFRLIKSMEKKKEENRNRPPSARVNIAFPKAKFGAYLAIIIVFVILLILYKDLIL